MAIYEVEHPETGEIFEIDSPTQPTEAQLRNVFSSQQPAQQQAPEGFMAKAKDLFTGNSKEAPESQNLREIGAAPELNAFSMPAFKTSAGLMASFDIEENEKLIKGNFPDAEFKNDSKGNRIVTLGGEDYFLNKAGFSGQDFAKLIPQFAAFGKAAQKANKVKGGKGILAVGAAEAGVSAGLDFTTGALSAGEGESAIRKGVEEVDGDEVLVAGGLGGGLKTIGMGVTKFRNRNVADDIADIDPAELSKLKEAADAHGIDLFIPQSSGSGSDLAAMQALKTLPASSQRIMKGLENQNKQVFEAVSKFIDSIAPSDSLQRASKATRDAAGNAIDAAKAERREITTPLYDAALKSKDKIDTSEIVKNIRKDLSSVADKSPEQSVLKRAVAMMQKDKASALTTRQLDSTYKSLGSQISAAKQKNKNDTVRRLTDIKNQVGELLEENAKGFKFANQEFARASKEIVEPLTEGQIGRIAKINDDSLRNVSKTIFSQAESNINVLKQTKSVISKQNPEAWRGIVRAHLEDGLSGLKEIATDGNYPEQIRKRLFGTPKQMRMLDAALDGEQRKNLNYLRLALKAAGRGRAGNSTTAAQQEFSRRLASRSGANVIDRIVRPKRALDDFLNYFKDQRNDAAAKKLSDLLMNPEWADQMKRIKEVKPNDPDALTGLLQTLERSDGEAG